MTEGGREAEEEVEVEQEPEERGGEEVRRGEEERGCGRLRMTISQEETEGATGRRRGVELR